MKSLRYERSTMNIKDKHGIHTGYRENMMDVLRHIFAFGACTECRLFWPAQKGDD
jgi:hypothetical protein